MSTQARRQDLALRGGLRGAFEMAVAYLFYLVKNHPFVDGNKRTALAACLAFLWLNDLELDAAEDDVTNLVLGVASGQISKAEVAVFLKGTVRLL